MGGESHRSRLAFGQLVHYILNSMSGVKKQGLKLSELELEVVELFVRVADVLNLPRSVGEIYGVLFVSNEPLCLDDCRERLGISKGSTSQGLRILRSFGAIRTTYVAGSRKDYYLAEASLRKMAKGFAAEQVQPHVRSGKERIEHIYELLKSSEDHDEVLQGKVDLLNNWLRRADRVLPFVIKMIGR